MTVDELQVIITANTEELRKEVDGANKDISGLKKTTEKSTDGMAKMFGKLKVVVAALGIGELIKQSIQDGMEAIETESLFDTVMGDKGDEVKAWANSVADTLGLSTVAMQKNIATIYNMTTSMGVAEGNALKMSKGISVLANDMASFYNLDSEEAFNKLRAGLTGEAEGLKALGILVDENTVKQTAYSAGIAANGAELTQEQKVLARYVAVLNQTGNAQGDLAKTLDSPSNMLRSLGQNVKNLSIAFSAILMPAVKFVLPWLNAFVKVTTDAVNGLVTLLGLNAEDTADAMQDMSVSAATTADGLEDANEKAKKLKKQLAGFDEMNVLQDNSSDSADTSAAATGGGLDFDLDEYNAKLELANGKTAVIAENIKGAFSTIGKYAKLAWDSEPVQAFVGAGVSYGKLLFKYWSTMGKTLYDNVKTLWGNVHDDVMTLGSNLVNLWTSVWTDLTDGIAKWGQPFVDGVSGLFNSILSGVYVPLYTQLVAIVSDLSGILLDKWNEFGQPLIDKVAQFVINIIGLFQSLWDSVLDPIITPFLQMLSSTWDEHIKPMVDAAADFLFAWVDCALEFYGRFVLPIITWIVEKLKPVFELFGKLFSAYIGIQLASMSDVATGIIGFLRGIIGFITSVFSGDWSAAWEHIKDAFKSIANIFVDIWNNVWGYLKTVLTAWKDFFVKIWDGIKGIFTTIGPWIYDKVIKPVANFFSGLWDGFKDGAKKAWDGVKSVFGAVAGFFKDVFTKAWKGVVAVFSVAGEIFVNIKDGIVSVFKTVVNGIINGINKVIKLPFEGFNKVLETIHDLSILGVKPFGWLTWRAPIPQIPELARGGIVDQPTYAMIGEAGKEAVMPLERNTGWIDQLADKLADKIGGGNGDIKLTVKLGEDTIFDKFIEYGRSKSFETNGEVVFA